ncbi:MAG TPA: hypothetical protein VFI42_21330, partial [Thermomicrobiaceae bacterium]|nr:hypothetical protein [Thermomicrobiaceae bacterium]
AIDYLTQAGAQAMAQVAYAEAADQFNHAVELLERILPERRAQLADTLLLLGRAQMATGEAGDARASLLRSVDVAGEIGAIERRATAAMELMDVAQAFTFEDIGVLQRAFSDMPNQDSQLRARVMSRLALLMTLPGFDRTPHAGELDAKQLATEALAMARRIDEPAIIAEALRTAYDVLAAYEDVDQRLAIATEMLSLAERIGSPQLEFIARSLRVIAFLLTGRVDEADREIAAYEAIATTYHLPFNFWSVTTKKAMRAFMRGDLTTSESLMERARALGQRADPDLSPVTYVWQSFFLRREQDRLGELEATLTAEADAHRTDWSGTFWQGLLAVLYADSGRFEQASAIISELVAPGAGAILPDTVSSFRLAVLALLADACATIDDDTHAPILVTAMEPHAHMFISPGNNLAFLGPVSHYLGRLLATMKERARAESQFRAALEAEARTVTPILRTQTLGAYAGLLAGSDDRLGDAQHLLDEANELAVRFNLPRATRIVRSLQRSRIACHSP